MLISSNSKDAELSFHTASAYSGLFGNAGSLLSTLHWHNVQYNSQNNQSNSQGGGSRVFIDGIGRSKALQYSSSTNSKKSRKDGTILLFLKQTSARWAA